MKRLAITKAFTLIEPGPVVLVTTNDNDRDNVMTISWTMVLGFAPRFAITIGPWNFSYAALIKTGECVIAIPTVDLLDTVIGVGTCSGKDTNKFETFGLTRVKAKNVGAALIAECLANIECRVADVVERYNIVILDGLAAYVNTDRIERRMIHAVGDGTFVEDGRHFDRREAMRTKLPSGV